jgi:hypothetical protein
MHPVVPLLLISRHKLKAQSTEIDISGWSLALLLICVALGLLLNVSVPQLLSWLNVSMYPMRLTALVIR